MVLVIGYSRLGAKRWISIGGENLQVSELMKLIIIIVLARYFTEVRTDRLTLARFSKSRDVDFSARRSDFEAARFGDGDGAGSRGGGRRIPRRH